MTDYVLHCETARFVRAQAQGVEIPPPQRDPPPDQPADPSPEPTE